MGCPACQTSHSFSRLRGGGRDVRSGGTSDNATTFSKTCPPKLLTLIRKLDAIEGKYLLRYAPPLERRSVGESDWLPPRFVWQNDADLFAS
jgi:hypothetical protein